MGKRINGSGHGKGQSLVGMGRMEWVRDLRDSGRYLMSALVACGGEEVLVLWSRRKVRRKRSLKTGVVVENRSRRRSGSIWGIKWSGGDGVHSVGKNVGGTRWESAPRLEAGIGENQGAGERKGRFQIEVEGEKKPAIKDCKSILSKTIGGHTG